MDKGVCKKVGHYSRQGKCHPVVGVVSGYNKSITINLNKITDMWNVGVA